MTHLYFMNLAIDQLWDEKKNLENIFSVRVPQSTHLVRINEDYSLLMSHPKDITLGYMRPDEEWLGFLSLHDIEVGQHFQLLANPYDRDLWLSEAESKLAGAQDLSLNSVGISSLEEQLLMRLKAHSAIFNQDKDQFIFLNSKKRILEIADKKDILIPKSFIESSQSLRSREGYLLKSEFSSGGGGSIDFSESTALSNFFLRKIQEGPESDWIWQKKCTRKKDWSYFGFTQNETPDAIMQVDYDAHLLSYRHRFARLDAETKNKLEQTWQIVRNFLIERKYDGPFGIDAFETESGEVYPLIDLNVRYTKTHFILAVAKRFALPDSQWECHRIRKSVPAIDFAIWWRRVKTTLHLDERGYDKDGHFIIPIQVGGLKTMALNGPVEVTYFCGKASGEYHSWTGKVSEFIYNESLQP